LITKKTKTFCSDLLHRVFNMELLMPF